MDNKIIFLGLIFIALISFMIFSDDDIGEEVGNNDALQQEIVADGEENDKNGEKIDQLSPKKNKPKRRSFTLDENNKKRKIYEKVIFIEIIFVVFLILVFVISWISFSFCEKKMAKDKEEMDKTILYYLENGKEKVDLQQFDDSKDGDSSDNSVNEEEERMRKAQEEAEREKKMIEDQKKLDEETFKANVSLTLKPKEDRIIVFHYNEDSKEDYNDYKEGKEAKAKKIADFFKKSFQSELNFYKDLASRLAKNENENNMNYLNSLAYFVERFLNKNDSDSFLKAVADEILSTLKILSLKGYNENNDLRSAAPMTYNFLGKFQPDHNIEENIDNNINNSNIEENNINNFNIDEDIDNNINVINNKVNNKQLVFNGYGFDVNNGGNGIINNETSIDTNDSLYKCGENEKKILNNSDEIWTSITNCEYKKYISLAVDKMQAFADQQRKIILLPDSEICPFKVLLHLLHIARFVVNEINNNNNKVDNKILVSVLEITNLRKNYNQYFEDIDFNLFFKHAN